MSSDGLGLGGAQKQQGGKLPEVAPWAQVLVKANRGKMMDRGGLVFSVSEVG